MRLKKIGGYKCSKNSISVYILLNFYFILMSISNSRGMYFSRYLFNYILRNGAISVNEEIGPSNIIKKGARK